MKSRLPCQSSQHDALIHVVVHTSRLKVYGQHYHLGVEVVVGENIAFSQQVVSVFLRSVVHECLHLLSL
jgi:hypothetical protein